MKVDEITTLPDLDDFISRLAFCIQQLGGKRAMARATGISEAQLFRYLRGESEPTASKLQAIAVAAKVDAGWVLTGHGKPEGCDEKILPHDREQLKITLKTFEESLGEVSLKLSSSQRSRFLDLIYTDTLIAKARNEYPFELNHLDMLFKLYFLAELKNEELERYEQFMNEELLAQKSPDINMILEPLTNQICRANTAIYNCPASTIHFDKMGHSVWPQAAKRLDQMIEEARELLGTTSFNWLDLGCGNGREISYIHRHYENIDVLGVDNADFCLELCQQYVTTEWLKPTSFLKADLRFLPVKAENFDVIYSRQTLEFFPYFPHTELGIIQVMKQAYKALRPGGIFMALTRYGHGREYVKFQQLFSVQDMEEIAKTTGFKVITLEPWNYTQQAHPNYPLSKYDRWLKVYLRKNV